MNEIDTAGNVVAMEADSTVPPMPKFTSRLTVPNAISCVPSSDTDDDDVTTPTSLEENKSIACLICAERIALVKELCCVWERSVISEKKLEEDIGEVNVGGCGQ